MNKLQKQLSAIKRAQKARAIGRWYNLSSILGNSNWAMFYALLGGRMTGKSYSLAKRFCTLHRKYGPAGCKLFWLRISDTSTKALLINKAAKLIDPDLVRKYDLELSVKGSTVFNHGEQFCEVLALSGMGKQKGLAFYDKDFKGKYCIVLDEFQLEQGERRTSFDILYNFIGVLENIGRTTKSNIEVWLVGNTLEEASTILKAFNFLPEKFGRFYLKSKRCVIDNMEPTEEYLKDRKGSMADILGGDDMSNYTNELTKDRRLLDKRRTKHPTAIIKFTTEKRMWFTLWDGRIIKRYHNEQLPLETDFCMRPHLNSYYSKEKRQAIIDMYDARAIRYDTLITQSYFSDAMKSLYQGR